VVDPLEVLDRIRQAKAQRPAPQPAQVVGKDPTHVGAPAHLCPGSTILDPISGQQGEVIAYGRAHVPGEVP